MEAGDVRVPVDAERVTIPIYVTTPEPVPALQVLLPMDQERLVLEADRDAVLEGTVGPYPDFVGVGVNPVWGVPSVGILYALTPPPRNLALGLHQHVLNFVFRPTGGFAEGESVQAPFLEWDGEDPRKGSLFTSPSVGNSVPADFYIPGEIRFGSSGPKEPLDLRWALDDLPKGAGSSVLLRWQNGEDYDAVRIERDGAPLAALPGPAMEFLDPGLPGGIYTYKVRGVVGGKTTFPARTFLSTLEPPGSFLRGDANGDGEIDISDALVTLGFLFLGGRRFAMRRWSGCG